MSRDRRARHRKEVMGRAAKAGEVAGGGLGCTFGNARRSGLGRTQGANSRESWKSGLCGKDSGEPSRAENPHCRKLTSPAQVGLFGEGKTGAEPQATALRVSHV